MSSDSISVSAPEKAEETTVAAEEKVTESTDQKTVELKSGMELQGTVSKIELQGAVLDVDMDFPGLLHISQLSAKRVKNVSDVLTEGQSVKAYVLAFDAKTSRLDLTLVKPPDVPWKELRVGQNYRGKVERIEKFGVFVNIGAERQGLIHVSELSSGYVSDPAAVVSIGDEIEAKIIGVNPRKKQIDLSIRALELEEAKQIEETEDEEDMPTAMEVALRRAFQESDSDFEMPAKRKKRSSKKRRNRRREQDDILERTLRFHDK